MTIVDWSPFHRIGLGPDKHVPRSDVHGILADATVRLNQQEDRRRRRSGVGAETRRAVVERLTTLPVSWTSTSEVARDDVLFLLDEAPDSIRLRHTIRHGTQVHRVLNPPLTLEHITVRARDWERGFDAVNSLAGLASRTLVLTNDPPDRELAEFESMLYGIGLAIDRAGDLQTLVVAEPFNRTVFTTLAWVVAERIYGSGLERHLL